MKTQATPSRHQPLLDLTFKANGETKSKVQGDEFVNDTSPVQVKPSSVLKDKIQISPEGISAGGIKIEGLALNSLQDGALQLKVPMNGPYGAKEAGEGPLHSSIPAIANAIYDAVGIRLFELPFSLAKILRALSRST